MVVSKRCKICTALNANNFPITGEYFGKILPDLIEKISGVNLDPRKANGVLICQPCAIQLIHVDTIVDKLRNTLQRLKKSLKESKPKTPSKVSAATESKRNGVSVDEVKNSDKPETIKINSETNADDPKTENCVKFKFPKKVVSRKSLCLDENELNVETKNNYKELENTEVIGKLVSTNDKISANNFSDELNASNSDESKSENMKKLATPKKAAARRKSVFPEQKPIDNDEEVKTSIGELDSSINQKEELVKKKPKTTPKGKNNDKNKLNEGTPTADVTTPKFKKIMDTDVMTPSKKSPTKRKLESFTNDSLHSNDHDSQLNDSITSKVKRSKLNITDDSVMNLTIDEQDDSYNESSAMANTVKVNCSICDKAFHKKSALRDHIESSHMGERLKSCPHCSSEFRSLQKYESHVFGEKCKTTNIICQYAECNKRFKTVHKMELHMQERHSSQNEFDE